MKIIGRIYRILIKCRIDCNQYKAIRLRIEKHYISDIPRINIMTDRIFFLIYLFLFPLKLLFVKKMKNRKKTVIFDVIFNNEEIEETKKFTSFYAKAVNMDSILFISGKKKLHYTGLSFSKLIKVFSIWIDFFKLGFFSLFDSSNFLYKDLLQVLWNSISLILLDNKDAEYYYYGLGTTPTYLSLILASRYTDRPINVFVGASALYHKKRYIFLNRIHLKLCSISQEDEVLSYQKKNWIKVSDTEMWGLECFDILVTLKVVDPIYDIGIYSSGSWARPKGISRSSDIEAIRSYSFVDNERHRDFIKIIETCIELKKEYGFSVKVYTHPYERALFNKHGVIPPYIKILKENDIDYDMNDKTSMESIYECELGISLSSSIIFDRWHLGLKGLIYFDKTKPEILQFFKPDYLGRFSKNAYKDFGELKEYIKREIRFEKQI